MLSEEQLQNTLELAKGSTPELAYQILRQNGFSREDALYEIIKSRMSSDPLKRNYDIYDFTSFHVPRFSFFDRTLSLYDYNGSAYIRVKQHKEGYAAFTLYSDVESLEVKTTNGVIKHLISNHIDHLTPNGTID